MLYLSSYRLDTKGVSESHQFNMTNVLKIVEGIYYGMFEEYEKCH